jgi:hypothetical protein
MDRPVKIIHKYKNKNRKIQYNVLIFIGNLISEPLNKVLKKIKDKNLYDTLTEINDRDISLLTKDYGSKWYRHFFIDKHIKHTFDKIIKSNEQKKNEIIKKYGQDWYNDNINQYINISKTIYSYQTVFKYDKEQKMKGSKIKIIEKDTDKLSYKISESPSIDEQTGGDISDSEIVNNIKNRIELENVVNDIYVGSKENINAKDDENTQENENENEGDMESINDEILQDQLKINIHPAVSTDSIDEYSVDELENISKDDVKYDKNVEQVNKTLQSIIDKTDIEEKDSKFGELTSWNETKDNNMYDDELNNVFIKTYIYNQYICIDDTIKVIKNKICCGYGKSKIFDKTSPYFNPSRIYLWLPYQYYDLNDALKHDKVMVGQKWVRRNELLDIDIEPHENIHTYETLKGNLKNLQENIKKYASRITFENDEQNILEDYDDFMVNDEIFMIDIYNDLGIGYQPTQEQLKNVYDVYVKIYYFGISQEDFKNILEYLNIKEGVNDKSIEGSKINLVYRNIQNDLINENEILKTIEELKKTPTLYDKIFKENFITQSVIHINIKHQNFKNSQKIDLYRIFDGFIVDDKYPFIQFQTSDGKLIFKYNSTDPEHDKEIIAAKWFENAPYGISFKIKVEQKGDAENKYISISLNENGRMDYKTQWKEEDQATITDVKKSYEEVRGLLRKINIENNKLKVEIPLDDKFKFAFINTIQQFDLPEKFLISHNDLSDFSRYFYPYIAVVIEPRKRQSKMLKKNEKSKYGTYLRYKRISKYENEASVEKRIMYFLRNYEFNEKLLSLEISKQFNITEGQALEKITYVIDKYPTLKKSRNILKKFENIPKYKPPGIGIDIQGKQRNKYKMRISGARSKDQLDGIINFMNILIYLYIETYLYKKPERQSLKEKLKTLSNIAKRRNKVDDIIESTEVTKTVKQITKLDKDRLGYKPEKGQNQWTRNCQNSGDNKKRRPIPFTDKNIDDMVKSGYILNNSTGEYEKKITKKGKTIILKSAKIDNYDGQGNSIYYTCDPNENGEYMYVGFLSRSANPSGLCMPCCFKKDPAISKNKEKQDYHMRCLGKAVSEIKTKKITGDKLYILQDTNKIQDGRFGYLSYYLDIYLNTMLDKDKIIRNNYLLTSNNGWFFKYGTKQDDDIFLTAVSNAIGTSVQHIKDRIADVLLKSENANSIFASLNNGDIKTQFGTINAYIRFLHTNFEVDYTLVSDILSIPGVVYDYGVNIIIFDKKTQYLDNPTDKKTLKDDFSMICINPENLHLYSDKNKINIIILKEEYNYYPIYQIKKKENSKDIEIDKTFKFEDDKMNIINHLYKYLKLNYSQSIIEDFKITNAKTTFMLMEKYGMKNYYPTKQIIDKRNKCKYFIIQDKYLLPVKPSGILFWIPIETKYEKYINDMSNTSELLYNIFIESKKEINVKPIGIYYTDREEDKYNVGALIIEPPINVPIKQIKIATDHIIEFAKKYKIREFLTESKSIYDVIDKEIVEYDQNNIIVDKRILNVNTEKYAQEGYELFRLELAYYLKDQQKLRERVIKIINNENISKEIKSNSIKKIFYKIINKQLYDIYSKINHDLTEDDTQSVETSNVIEKASDDSSEYFDDTDLVPINIVESIEDIKKNEQKGGEKDDIDIDNLQMFVNQNRRLVNINDVQPDLSDYKIKNNREICPMNNVKNSCNSNPHCQWKVGSCLFRVTTKQLVEYINKISEELVSNELKSSEMLMKDSYFVSDIVNKEYYTTRDSQKIIKSNNNNIKRILSDLFGKSNIPIIGKRRMNKISKSINEDNLSNPLEIIGNRMYQNVHFVNPIYRAFSNCYFWNKNELLEQNHRNLGYYSLLQTDLSNYFKSKVIDWITNKKNQDTLLSDLEPLMNFNKETFINDIKRYLARSSEVLNSYAVDLYVLSKLYNYTIYLYDNYDNIIGIFDDGIKYLSNYYMRIDKDKYKSDKQKINIKFNISNYSFTNTPSSLLSIYYS